MGRSQRVEIRELSKLFISGKKTVKAVDNVNLNIEAGEFICLLGPSGCGKTTMLRMLAGFEIPSTGNIYLGGKDLAYLTPDKRDTAMVFQNYALFPHLNVFDNIAYGLKVQRKTKAEISTRVHKILELMKMSDFAERTPAQMSGGQQQRVSLARALIMNSAILLFDEPLSNLDAKLRLHMRDEIRNIQQKLGISSIYVTHDQAEAMALSDRIVVMKDGKIMQVGSPVEIYQKPNSEFIAKFIGRANTVPAKILAQENAKTTVEILGAEYSISEGVSFAIGETLKVVIRPESIKLAERPKHQGKIIKSIFMGENHEYEVLVKEQVIEISLNNPHGKRIRKVGEILEFSFEEASLHLI